MHGGRNGKTYLVLFTAVAKSRLAQVVDHGLTAHLVIVIIWDVVILALEGLARGIFAFTGDLANALGSLENSTNISTGRARRATLA